MYVHLGGDTVVLATEVVTILDARLLETSEDLRRLVDRAAREGRLRGNGITSGCKSLVITSSAVYPSTVSSVTLARRISLTPGSAGISWPTVAEDPS